MAWSIHEMIVTVATHEGWYSNAYPDILSVKPLEEALASDYSEDAERDMRVNI